MLTTQTAITCEGLTIDAANRAQITPGSSSVGLPAPS